MKHILEKSGADELLADAATSHVSDMVSDVSHNIGLARSILENHELFE